MTSTIELLSNKLIAIIKKPYFTSNGLQIHYPNFSDYFSISNEKDEKSEFSCKIEDIQMAIDILEITNRKLELPELNKTLTTGQFYNEILSNEINIDMDIYLNYFKYSKHIN
ncbi:hypothetical protein SAMN05421594_0399 [Chryseobacterium oleae]|uniref:Uncharacterized protein n=1 Tax=Chryseobacterium oleae TaxID=491207 RepID=A0A1I4VL59_CHROL|nr:hypothetical protein [Chryseobacterium oleae]SFN01839.1 hypothetical protein SAMN05421594_0399 [Chryseobacterium oleae]